MFQCKLRTPIWGIIALPDGIYISIQCLFEASDPREYHNTKDLLAIPVLGACSADYKVSFLSGMQAGSTHDPTAFQAAALYNVPMGEQEALPSWAMVVADNAFQNKMHVRIPSRGRHLSRREDSFNFYLSQCQTAVEQVFDTMVARFGMLWSPLL